MLTVRVNVPGGPNMRSIDVGTVLCNPFGNRIGEVVDWVVHTSRDMDLIIKIDKHQEECVKQNYLCDDYEESGDDLLLSPVRIHSMLVIDAEQPEH